MYGCFRTSLAIDRSSQPSFLFENFVTVRRESCWVALVLLRLRVDVHHGASKVEMRRLHVVLQLLDHWFETGGSRHVLLVQILLRCTVRCMVYSSYFAKIKGLQGPSMAKWALFEKLAYWSLELRSSTLAWRSLQARVDLSTPSVPLSLLASERGF